MDNRFRDVMCDLLDIKSPEDIKHEELVKLLREHFNDTNEEHFYLTQAGILYRLVFDEGDE